MKLSNKKVTAVVVLITIALSGLVILQTIMLNTALKAEEETFRSNVILALNNVIKDLSSFEAKNAILNISINDSTSTVKKRIIKTGVFNDSISDTVFIFRDNIKSTVGSSTDYFEYFIDDISVTEKLLEPESSYEVSMVFSDSITTYDSTGHLNYFQKSHVFAVDGIDSARIFLIEAALGQLEQMEFVPIEKRLDTLTLDSAITESFNINNIELDFSFAITNSRSDSLIFSRGDANLTILSDSPYRTLLFPNDHISPRNYLVVDFPNKQFYIYSKLMSLIIPTVLFLLIIISCFVYSIKMILAQRRTSVQLTDFINNMTHEFKTPISTIQLATEAIVKDEVLSDSEKLLSYNDMIQSENRRMKNQVDKILQIATLEEGDYILKREHLDMHLLIKEAVDAFSMLAKQNKGTINTTFKADHAVINGDRVHVLNIISNLIDNALKYSGNNPNLNITTTNKDSAIELSIKDNGIGIHPDDLKLVFNKYYRVSSGDIHNIKGFGLGLSYVKMMVEAHDGSVAMLSSLDKGTEVIISLPLNKYDE